MLSEVIVRGSTPLVLDASHGMATFSAIQSVVQRAGVSHGIEAAPGARDVRDVRSIDFARPADRIVAVEGMSVGQVLDLIVQADPRYQWSETAERILVRAATTQDRSALNTLVEHVAVTEGSFVDALTALIDAIDPSRPRPELTRIGVGFETSHATPSPRPDERRITVTLQHVTLLGALNAIADAHGHLSWTLRYDGEDPSFANASITLHSPSGFATAPSALAARENARLTDPDRIMIPIIGPLSAMLRFYAARARVQLAIELLPENAQCLITDVPWVDLTGFSPATAISRLVAFDSRFETVDAGGLFNVRPKPEDASTQTVLERRIASFSAQRLTTENILDLIVKVVNGVSDGSGRGEGGLLLDTADRHRRITESRNKTLSLTLQNATLRDVLNAVCRAHGTLSWTMQPHSEHRGHQRYSVAFDSYDGWSITKWFRIDRSSS